MQGILLDNWSIENIITCSTESDKINYSKEYMDLLEAIVLWDDLYYPENSYSSWWKYIAEDHSINKIIQPLHYDEDEFNDEIDKKLKGIGGTRDFTDNVVNGAVRYMLLSNKNGLNYFPCNKRCLFLEQSKLYDNLKNINRFDIMRTFDREIVKYYKELNNFFGKNIFVFEFPVLVNYIIQNTPSNMSYIDYAIKLREDKRVVAYREYLNEIEVAINNTQWDKLRKFEKETKGLVRDIFETRELIDSISVNLLALPSFNVPISNLPSKKNVHLCFLRKLGDFAYKGKI